MKPNNKTIFVCQVSENSLTVLKFRNDGNTKKEMTGLEIEALQQDKDDKRLATRLNQVLRKLGYNNNPLIISLPRNFSICRYIKIPTQLPEEIEKIVSLQAQTYLPYTTNELIIGYQSVSEDKEGYSDLNVVIVHKDVIERYIKVLKELKITGFSIVLSPYGLCNLYNYINPGEPGPVMLVEINSNHVELAIDYHKKLLFSRYFKNNESQANWEGLFIDEVDKTLDAYLKEVPQGSPRKVVILGRGLASQRYADILSKKISLPLEAISYDTKIAIAKEPLRSILNYEDFCIAPIGLGLGKTEDSLNLLPRDEKERRKKAMRYRRHLRLILIALGAIVMWALAMSKNLDNKARYLKLLKTELSKIEKEARPLEDIEQRLKMLENRSNKKISSLDILYEIHQTLPAETSLVNFNYEEDGSVILRGQASRLNTVFTFVSQLEKSPVFKNLAVKVRYATKRSTRQGETVDFEIVCSKK